MADHDVKFHQWKGYKDLEEVKQMISYGCYNDPKLILEHAAKMSIEREYFKNMLLFIQYRIKKYLEEGEVLGLGIDSSKEIFEGLMIVPAEDVSFPGPEEDNEESSSKNCQQFIEDMKRAGIKCEDYEGMFFYHGPAVKEFDTKKGGIYICTKF